MGQLQSVVSGGKLLQGHFTKLVGCHSVL